MNEKIRYKDLSVSCKIGIISGWICGCIYTIAVLVGVVEGILGV